MNTEPLLEVSDLEVTFHVGESDVTPLTGITLTVSRDETIGIVGESGSGKSVLVRTIMGLIGDGKNSERRGTIHFADREISKMSAKQLRGLWGNRIGMILQDPMSSLNPVRRIGVQLTETLRWHHKVSRGDAKRRAVDLLTEVGIPDPESRLGMYPHELSGGQRQRVMIAIALAGEIELLIADEPTTALDVSIQNQILNLLERRRRERGMSMLLVTHDLAVAAGRTDRIVVMYAGEIVESAPTAELFDNVRMPYTRALLDASPKLADPSRTRVDGIRGLPPNLSAVAPGCRFAARCRFVQDKCRQEHPPLAMDPDGHSYRCWFPLGEERGRAAAAAPEAVHLALEVKEEA